MIQVIRTFDEIILAIDPDDGDPEFENDPYFCMTVQEAEDLLPKLMKAINNE